MNTLKPNRIQKTPLSQSNTTFVVLQRGTNKN